LKSVVFPSMDLALPVASITDLFYLEQVVRPLTEKILLLLHSRRFRYSKEIRTWVLIVLAESGDLKDHLGTYQVMLNSDQISTLVEFAEAFRGLGPHVLQYVPGLIAHIRLAGSPLVKHLVKLLQKATRLIDPRLALSLFPPPHLVLMARHKDPFARRLAVYLLGLECRVQEDLVPHMLALARDPQYKVRRQVLVSLGDLLKNRPDLWTTFQDHPFLAGLENVGALRNLSLATGRPVRIHRRMRAELQEDDDEAKEDEF